MAGPMLNRVTLLGRLTRDPESRTFANGGKVTYFGFAVSGQKKNPNTGDWEDDPMFVDVKVFNRGDFGKKADLAEEYLHKGSLIYLEGKLILERWEQDGQKRSKHVIHADNFQFLEPKSDSSGGGSSNYSSGPVEGPEFAGSINGPGPVPEPESTPNTPGDSEIPF